MNKNSNGSIMIAALIVTLVTGSLVGLFLSTITAEARNSYRSRMAFQAVNIAEAGLEYAIYSVKSGDWSGWTDRSSGKYRSAFPRIDIVYRNERRSAKVYVEPNHSPPRAIAEGQIANRNGIVINKQIYIELGNRSLFANGVLAKQTIKFNGQNIAVDSYRSSLGAYDTTLNRNDNGSVASLSLIEDDLNLGNADIWGTAATGGSIKSEVTILKNGSVRGKDTPAGVRVDLNRIALDFYAALPDPEVITFSTFDAMPSSTASATGKYDVYSLGTDDSSVDTYNYQDFEIKSKEALIVYGDVVLNVENDIDINGTVLLAKKGDVLPDGSVVTRDATLEINVGDDFVLGGPAAAFLNGGAVDSELLVRSDTSPGEPVNVLLTSFGTPTATDSVDFTLHGNGSFSGAVYAPNAEISLDGSGKGGEMFGAVVGNTITFGGGYQFHYDEDLADLEDEDAKKVTRWVELTDAGERQKMASILKHGF
ncbi:MAG: collagen-binding domain-containing protein [Puniceicoccaceae bacterium]